MNVMYLRNISLQHLHLQCISIYWCLMVPNLPLCIETVFSAKQCSPPHFETEVQSIRQFFAFPPHTQDRVSTKNISVEVHRY